MRQLTALAALAVAACAPQPDTWRLVTEHADGSSQIADYGLTLADCDARADAMIAAPWSVGEPVIIYCERY
jgi:hypothetical protein